MKSFSIHPKYLIAIIAAAVLFLALLIFLIIYLNQPEEVSFSDSSGSSVSETLIESSDLSSELSQAEEPSSEGEQESLGSSSVTAASSETSQSRAPSSSSSSKPSSSSSSTSASTADGDILAGLDVDSLPWNLSVANAWHVLSDSRVADTSIVYTIPNCSYGVDSRARDNLVAMVNDANAAGLSLWYSSIYRSVDSQKNHFEQRVQQVMSQTGKSRAEAEIEAATVVARPGTSDHNLGLAVDFNGCKTAFKDTAEYKWLIEHCADYGYILRYPSDKQDITKVVYEPWHYRYVGVEHAKIIMEKKITLEEYVRDYIL